MCRLKQTRIGEAEGANKERRGGRAEKERRVPSILQTLPPLHFCCSCFLDNLHFAPAPFPFRFLRECHFLASGKCILGWLLQQRRPCTALHRQPWASPATPASPPSPRSTFLLHSHSCIPFNAFPAPFAFTPETLCLRWNKSLTTNSLSKQKEQKRRSNYLQRYKYLRHWKYWQCCKYLARYKYLRRRKSYDVANIYNVASTYDAATTYKIACTYMYDVVSTIVGQKL